MKKIILLCLITSCIHPVIAQTINLTENEKPLDGIVDHKKNMTMKALPYAPVRTADVLWEKRIWRVIDTREKINLTFRYPKMPLFTILEKGIREGQITAYSPEDEHFSMPMDTAALFAQLYQKDTVEIIDVETGLSRFQVVENQIDPEDIKYFRLKEIWYFDTRESTLKVRILGIAPVMDVKGESGNVRYKKVLFWLYYPHCRDLLASHEVFNPNNDFGRMTWEDLFEMRYFSSHIMKESNIRDERLQAMYSGTDLLLKAEEIEQQIFNFEQDLWSY